VIRVIDCRYVVRSLGRSRWYACGVLVVVALGVCLNTAVFEIVDGTLFRPLPYARPFDLFRVFGGTGDQELAVAPPDVHSWKSAIPTIGMFQMRSALEIVDPLGRPLKYASIDQHFLPVLGVRTTWGGFRIEDFQTSAELIPVLVTRAFWTAWFQGRREGSGQTLRDADGHERCVIVGVLPADFVFPDARVQPQVLGPLRFGAAMEQDWRLRAFGAVLRRPDWISRPDVARRLNAVISRHLDRLPDAFDRVVLKPLDSELTGLHKGTFALVFAAATTLTLLTAVNITSLILSRVEERQRELNLRTALGASQWDVVRPFAFEVSGLVSGGSILGVLVSLAAVRAIRDVLPIDAQVLGAPRLDWRGVTFVVLTIVCTSTIALVGVAKTLSRRRTLDVVGGAATRRVRRWSSHVLIALEVGLGLTLATCGTLVVRSLSKAWNQDTGLAIGRSVVIDLALGPGAPGLLADRAQGVLNEVRSHPGVRSAALFQGLLMQRGMFGTPFRLPDSAKVEDLTGIEPVSSQFFQVMGIRPLLGRLPSDAEMDRGAHVLAVSQRVAKSYWPGSSAVGKLLNGRLGPVEVVGVVPDVRFRALDLEPTGEIYMSVFAMGVSRRVSIVAEARTEPRVLASSLGSTLGRAGPGILIERIETGTAVAAGSIRVRQLQGILFGSFGIGALGIVVIGVFGFVGMAAARRVREVGIRLAVGATPVGVTWCLARQQMRPVIAGAISGVLGAAFGAAWLRASLYGIGPYDVVAWAESTVVVVGAALGGVLIPLHRASRVAIVDALREP